MVKLEAEIDEVVKTENILPICGVSWSYTTKDGAYWLSKVCGYVEVCNGLVTSAIILPFGVFDLSTEVESPETDSIIVRHGVEESLFLKTVALLSKTEPLDKLL